MKELEEMPAYRNEEESSSTVRVIFQNDRSIIKGLPADPDTLLIWRVKQRESFDSEEFVEIGWTQIDLFSF